MKFISPERLYWIAALILPAAALVYAGIRRRREFKRLFSGPVPHRAVRLSRGARSVRLALVFFAMICASIAAARPYWKSFRTTVSGRGRDVAVVFDVSKSMWARDLAPSRLEHAKFLLRRLVRKLPGDRLALIAFAGNAYTACPLTADPAVFDEYVDELSADAVQLGGTDLERALREAVGALDGTPGTQAIVVLTDGDELAGDSSRAVAELKKRGIPLIVIGLGDPARPAELPDAEGNVRRGRDGKVITSVLAEDKLKRIAAETGGAYIRSTVTDPGDDAAAARIAELAPAEYGETEKEIPEERSGLFIWLAFAALAAALLLPERPLRRTAALLLVFCALFATGAAEEVPDGGIAGARTAAELYNLGLERHGSGDLDGAGRCFEAVLRHPDRDERVRAKALFNLGAMEHDRGRTIVAGARDLVRKQQLDPALEKLAAAEGKFAAARELYFRALSGSGAAAAEDAAADDLRLYEKDLADLEKLKAAIEELKKQQQKAQQSARNAQRQDRQQQQQQKEQQQNGGQQQQGARQKEQPQQTGGQDQKPPQGAQPPQTGEQKPRGAQPPQSDGRDGVRSAARRAAEESGKLREQAKELGQSELEERARRAEQELRAAENSADPREMREHLDRAVGELGAGEEKKPDGNEKSGEGEKKAGGGKPGGNENKDAEDRPGKAEEAGEKASGECPDGGARLLDVLDGEERETRRRLRRGAPRPPVGRDW